MQAKRNRLTSKLAKVWVATQFYKFLQVFGPLQRPGEDPPKQIRLNLIKEILHPLEMTGVCYPYILFPQSLMFVSQARMEWVSKINLGGSSAGDTLLEEGIIQLLGDEDDTKSLITIDPAESILTGDITNGAFIVHSMLTHIHLPLP